MKRLLGITVISFGGLAMTASAQSASSVVAAATTASVTRQIEPLLTEMMAAANAHDTDRYMMAFMRGPDVVFAFNGTIIQGWADLDAQQLKWWNNGKSDVVYAERGAPVITVLARDAAVVTMGLDSHRTMANGQAVTGTAVVTMVWQKRPEGWRVVQAHESTIH